MNDKLKRAIKNIKDKIEKYIPENFDPKKIPFVNKNNFKKD